MIINYINKFNIYQSSSSSSSFASSFSWIHFHLRSSCFFNTSSRKHLSSPRILSCFSCLGLIVSFFFGFGLLSLGLTLPWGAVIFGTVAIVGGVGGGGGGGGTNGPLGICSGFFIFVGPFLLLFLFWVRLIFNFASASSSCLLNFSLSVGIRNECSILSTDELFNLFLLPRPKITFLNKLNVKSKSVSKSFF